ncbi:MAG: glycogen debranching enzyme N-terminal domain-containing protein [Bacteroidales bacterium]|nr:glycogen debranching enzyme N-terminal domain-containing protein [Bacteroidales bacterium]
MAYLKFEKEKLVNLEYSLQREYLSANQTGGYCNTTIVGCNTRKYHGLFVVPLSQYDGKRHILLSSMDETLIQHGEEFNLGIRCYGPTNYEPRGHKYIIDFSADKSFDVTYRVGGMIFRRSLLFCRKKEQLLIKYTLLEAHSETTLRFKPFLSFREIHTLTHANDTASRSFASIPSGAAFRMYEGFPDLNIQCSKPCRYNHQPDWFYGVTYQEERRRGFEYSEDLYCPGYFELPIKKGESIVVSVSTEQVSPAGIARAYNADEASRPTVDSYEACLKEAAHQLIIRHDGLTEVLSGYTWMSKTLRDALISLPGLTLWCDGDKKTFEDVLKSIKKTHATQLIRGSKQADAPLWLFWDIQQLIEFTGNGAEAWKNWGKLLKEVAESYIDGLHMGVSLSDNGLLWTKMQGVALSWMCAYGDDGQPITERGGWQVETNALWYNALRFIADSEEKWGSDKKSVIKWRSIADRIQECFYDIFWVEERQHLADYIDENGQNVFTRPNMILACSLEYSPINEEARAKVLEACKLELLTERGLRTLAPKNPLYKGVYDGDQHHRDLAFHQGSTRVWLMPFYFEGRLKIYKEISIPRAIEYMSTFEQDMTEHGIGSICQLYDGDPPHRPHGAISGAAAVSGILRAIYLVSKYKEESK